MRRAKAVLLLAACGLVNAADNNGGLLGDWLRGVAFRQLEARKSEVNLITTRAQAEARGRQVRTTLLRMLGGLPQDRTPLNLRKTGTINRGDYRIDKIVFESLPKFYVTANLYVPQSGHGPYPAVLQPVGHSTAAKSRAFYQTLALGLVKSGFVVLTYDPLGQGERRIFYDADLGDSKVGSGTREHQMVGAQCLLAGESVARYMVWDGIRSIDALASLPEVDASRIAVAGCSGGGTLTAYLAAIDDRLKAAAPACYITSWEDQLAGTGPQDAEQQFPDQLKEGLDHADFATAFAPKPYLQVNTEGDFFPIAGARRAAAESKRIYELFDAGSKISWAVGPGGHGIPQVVREAIYGWMNQWLKGGPAGPLPEPAFRTEYEEALYCTATGQVSTSLGGETASTVNMRRYGQMHANRPPLQGTAGVEALRARVRREIGLLTRYETPTGPVGVQFGAETRREGYNVRSLTYGAPGGRRVPALLAVPDAPHGKAVLLVFEDGSAAALGPRSDGDALARLGHVVLAVDAAGFGGSTAKWTGYSDSWFGPDNLAWLAMMTGKPLVGLGIEDLLAALDVLDGQHLLGAGCVGFSKGITSIDLLHAAALDTRLGEVIVEGGLTSYEAVARAPIHRRVMAGVVPGVLGRYDLPDLAASLAPRRLSLVGMRAPAGEQVLEGQARDAYGYAFAAYAASGAPGGITIGLRRENEPVEATYPQLR